MTAYFLRLFLTFFSVLLIGVSFYFFVNPKQYWAIAKRKMVFQGILGAKPTTRFYQWVKISSLVQIVAAVAILAYTLLVLQLS